MRPQTDRGILRSLGSIFSPSVPPGEEFPVAGVGAKANGTVNLFMARPEVRLNKQALDEVFGSLPVLVEPLFTGPFELCHATAASVSPGDSISLDKPEAVTGSLGCVVRDFSGKEFLLSCCHVIADCGDAKIGSGVRVPGSGAGGGPNDVRAILHNFERLCFQSPTPNQMDAAIAAPTPGTSAYGTIPGGIFIAGCDDDPDHNCQVQKFGWKTKRTLGSLAFKNISMKLRYPERGWALFINVYGVIEPTNGVFAEPGDSGALVLNMKNEAIGVLFSRALKGKLAMVCPIEPILTRFDVNF
jgi:hypothetical protein